MWGIMFTQGAALGYAIIGLSAVFDSLLVLPDSNNFVCKSILLY